MPKKESHGLKAGTVIISSLIGYLIYIIFVVLMAACMKWQILSPNMPGLCSKVALFISTIIACSIAKRQGRGEEFINSIISAFMVFVLVILTGMLDKSAEIDLAGTIICLMLCVTACFLIFIKRHKNSKLHKRRIRRRSDYTNCNHRKELT